MQLLEADLAKDRAQRGALGVELEVAAHDAAVGLGVVVGGRLHQRAQRGDELVEQRAHLGGRHAGLVVVEQDVVGVLGVGEAGGVAPAQLDLARERVTEAPEVAGLASLDPGREAARALARHLDGERLRHARRLLVVAAGDAHEPDVVGVGVGAGRPRLQRVEQPDERRVDQARVGQALQRRELLRPRLGRRPVACRCSGPRRAAARPRAGRSTRRAARGAP